jgi:hypothetical protein
LTGQRVNAQWPHRSDIKTGRAFHVEKCEGLGPMLATIGRTIASTMALVSLAKLRMLIA